MPREEGGEHRMLQVELNTIASSFGCLSDKVSQLHRFLLLRFGESHGLLQWFVTKYPELGSVADLLKEITEKEAGENSEKEGLAARLPINGALQGTPNALAVAAKVYIDQQGDSGSTPRPLIVFVVQEVKKIHTHIHMRIHLRIHMHTHIHVQIHKHILAQIHKHIRFNTYPYL